MDEPKYFSDYIMKISPLCKNVSNIIYGYYYQYNKIDIELYNIAGKGQIRIYFYYEKTLVDIIMYINIHFNGKILIKEYCGNSNKNDIFFNRNKNRSRNIIQNVFNGVDETCSEIFRVNDNINYYHLL